MKNSKIMLQVVARLLRQKDVKQKGDIRKSSLIPEVTEETISHEDFGEAVEDLLKLTILSLSVSPKYYFTFNWNCFHKAFS